MKRLPHRLVCHSVWVGSIRSLLGGGLLAALAVALVGPPAAIAAEKGAAVQGHNVFTAGHSFHVFMPKTLAEVAASAGIEGHRQVGVQSIGGSRVIQHWNQSEDKNKVKPTLASGEVDVLTLSPIYLPDEGIEKLASYALEHNKDCRILVQEFWLPFDVYAVDYKQKRPERVDRNSRTPEMLRQISAPYFASMDAHVKELNEKFGKPAVQVVPVGQAVIALREKIIAGEAPGIKEQEELFTDAIGHATPPLRVLVAYCHYAVIYGRSPEGLPMPRELQQSKYANEELNRLLQQLAWQAASEHPLSGVK